MPAAIEEIAAILRISTDGGSPRGRGGAVSWLLPREVGGSDANVTARSSRSAVPRAYGGSCAQCRRPSNSSKLSNDGAARVGSVVVHVRTAAPARPARERMSFHDANPAAFSPRPLPPARRGADRLWRWFERERFELQFGERVGSEQLHRRRATHHAHSTRDRPTHAEPG